MAIKFLSDQIFPTDIFLVDVSLGRIGVNTLLPRTALEVVGVIRVWSGSSTHTYVETSSGSNLGSIQAKKNSDNAVRSLALNPLGGNVGVGLGAGIIPDSNFVVGGELKIGSNATNYVTINSDSSSTTFNTIGSGFSPPDVVFQSGSVTKLTIKTAGDVGIGTTNPRAKLDVDGGVKVANDTDTAGSNKVGTLRYRYVPGSPKSYSYCDMCMQTGSSSYAWVNIVQNVF